MPTTPEALATAVEHHQAGRLHEAEPFYRLVLADDPQNIQALHLLGLLSYQLGRRAAALEFIDRAAADARDETRPFVPIWR